MYTFTENPDLVLQETDNSQSQTNVRPAKCDSRQTIQVRPHHLDRVVPLSRGPPVDFLLVIPVTNGPVCHQF